MFGDNDYLIKTIEKDTNKNTDEALIDIHSKLRPGEPSTLESAKNQLITRFFDAFRYDLAKVGRYKFNKKLNITDRLLGCKLAEDIKVNGEIIAKDGDVVYCDPPYTHSQSIIYGAQEFSIKRLFNKIAECKERGVRVLLSINGMRDNGTKDISITPPPNLFERRIIVSCGTSMIDRLQNTGRVMENKKVDDQLLLTW